MNQTNTLPQKDGPAETLRSSGWFGIDSAPKDGTRILVAHRGRHQIAQWDDDKYARKPKPFWRTTGPWGVTADRANPPTVWAPLPPLPNTADEQRRGKDSA